MTTRGVRDPNFVPSVVVENANSALSTLAVTGRSLSNATPMDVNLVDGTGNPISSLSFQSKTGTVGSSGNNTILSAGTNKLKIFAFSLTTGGTTSMTVKFQDGAGGTDLWGLIMQAPTSITTGANLAVTPPTYLFKTSTATLLNINLSQAQTVQYSISYWDSV